MEKLLIPLGFIVLMSVLGYLTQMLKRTAEKRQMERDRERARERAVDRQQREPLRTGSSDIDRYLRAVDAQRQKAAPPARPPQPKPPVVPTVAKARPRVVDTIAPTFPESKRKGTAAKVPVAAALDDLPVASVIGGTSAAPVVTAPAQLAKPQRASVAPPSLTADAPTTFGRQFVALVKGPNALALAFALQEVLGPPKCKRG
jgi:hypothetical protein